MDSPLHSFAAELNMQQPKSPVARRSPGIRGSRIDAAIVAIGAELQALARQWFSAACCLPESPDVFPHVGKKGLMRRLSGRKKERKEERKRRYAIEFCPLPQNLATMPATHPKRDRNESNR